MTQKLVPEAVRPESNEPQQTIVEASDHIMVGIVIVGVHSGRHLERRTYDQPGVSLAPSLLDGRND